MAISAFLRCSTFNELDQVKRDGQDEHDECGDSMDVFAVAHERSDSCKHNDASKHCLVDKSPRCSLPPQLRYEA